MTTASEIIDCWNALEEKSVNLRRVKYFPITPDAFVMLCKQSRIRLDVVANRLPEDARSLGVEYRNNTFYIIIHSNSFPSVGQFEAIPLLEPTEFKTVE